MILVIKVTVAGLPLITLKDHFYSQVHQLTMKQALSLASVWICDDGCKVGFRFLFNVSDSVPSFVFNSHTT